MTKKIFLSHAIPDKEKVASIAEKLQQRWSHDKEQVVIVDPVNETPVSEDLRKRIRQGIQDSDEVVVVWTTATAAHGLVNYELGMADALGKPIVVVTPDKSAPELPGRIRVSQVIRLAEES